MSRHFAGYSSVALETIWLHEPRDLIFLGPLMTLLCLSRYSMHNYTICCIRNRCMRSESSSNFFLVLWSDARGWWSVYMELHSVQLSCILVNLWIVLFRWSLLSEHRQATTKEDIDTTATALLHKLDEVRRAIWTEVVESVDFTHSSRKAWQTINKLTSRSTTHSRCPVTANAIASQLLNNGRFPDADRDFARWTSREVTSLSRAATADTNLSSDFTVEELEAAIKKLKSGKAPGRDNIHPEFVIHQSAKTTAWLYVRSSRRVSEDPSYRRPGAVLPSWRSQNQINLRKTPSRTDPSHCYAILERMIQPHRPCGGPTASSWTSRLSPWSINGGPSNTTNTIHRRQLSEQWEGWGSVSGLDSCIWHRVAPWTPPETA